MKLEILENRQLLAGNAVEEAYQEPFAAQASANDICWTPTNWGFFAINFSANAVVTLLIGKLTYNGDGEALPLRALGLSFFYGAFIDGLTAVAVPPAFNTANSGYCDNYNTWIQTIDVWEQIKYAASGGTMGWLGVFTFELIAFAALEAKNAQRAARMSASPLV